MSHTIEDEMEKEFTPGFHRSVTDAVKVKKSNHGGWIPVSEILQEIKKEIELKEKTLTDKYGQVKYGVWTDDVCNVFDKYIEKYSNT